MPKWCPYRRKWHIGLTILLVLILQPGVALSKMHTDFDKDPLKEDFDSMLEDGLFVVPRSNVSRANRNNIDVHTSSRQRGVDVFLSRTYDSSLQLLPEDEFTSQALASETLFLNRGKRAAGNPDIFQESGSGNFNECDKSEYNQCDGPYDVCNDLQEGYQCVCIEGYTRDNGICYAEMYANGITNGDGYLPNNDEGFLRIDIEDGIPFASKLYYSLFISVNGVISFGSRFGSYSPRLPTWNQNILAPYWADIDLTVTSDTQSGIYYHVYNSAVQNDQSILTQISKDVNRYFSKRNFDASWCVIVTWQQVSQKGVSSDTKTATFQVVLVSDGESTYALYIYNRLGWEVSDVPIYIGYESANPRDRRQEILLVSNTRAAYSNDGISSNTGIPGVYKFDIGGTVNNFARLCTQWYLTQKADYDRHFWDFIWLPDCPCNRRRAARSWTFRLTSIRWEYRRIKWCYTALPYDSFPLSRECCYRNNRLLTSQQESGSALRWHPWFFGRHYNSDVLGRLYCCQKSNNCDKYFSIRPQRGCQRWPRFFWGWGFGDPHVTTLDAHTFIFNGYGEYTMIEIEEENDRFLMQTRTSLALNKDGNETTATIFSAFAATDYKNTFTVELNPARDDLIIYKNSKDMTLGFRNNQNFSEGGTTKGDMTVLREDNDVIGMFGNGLQLRVSLGPKLLTFSVAVPVKYKGKTKGLMGNYNDDTGDDLMYRNGSTISLTTSEAEIYRYGQTWQIDPSKSYLRYPPRKNASDFAHLNFEPLYLDQASEPDRKTALEKCGNDEKNLACIFDYLATKDEAVSESSKSTEEEAGTERKEQSNTIPTVNSSVTIFNVELNKVATFNLTANDTGDNLTYRVVDQPENNVTLTEEDQVGTEKQAVVYWTPTSTNPDQKISIIVVDSNEAESEPIEVQIRLCDGCSDHGTCNYTQTRTDANSASSQFQLAACTCDTGWAGENCSLDFDGCHHLPCLVGQNCTDLPPDQEVSLGRTHNCSACPTGYNSTESGDKCQDINECNGSHGCAQKCTNTVGSFVCSCYQGYRKTDESCSDINECDEGLHDCEQLCENTQGSFHCSCQTGYSLKSDNKTCEQDGSGNPCAPTICEYGCLSTNSCFCAAGYTLMSNQINCTDIDECKQNICAQTCKNTDGSYTCGCYVGFVPGNDKISCEPCPTLMYGTDCSQRCDCGDRADRCDSVRGCICKNGWTGDKCDVDVDECEQRTDKCELGSTCVNTNGSFVCNCQTGYTKAANGSCVDVNECDSDKNSCAQECTNTVGSYFCTCIVGYKEDGENCTDVNECTSDQNTCSQMCINVDGSYNCDCEFGFRLTDDRKSCEMFGDVCKGVSQLECDHGCTVKRETEEAYCFCKKGYNLGSDNQTCIDIIECDSEELNKCTHTCTNTLGGYSCGCPLGFQLDNDMLTCKECGAFHWGVDCSTECSCGTGATRCDSKKGCVCKNGWLGILCDQDVNECEEEVACPANSRCDNTPGSYRCACTTGFIMNTTTNTCEDINECDDPNLNSCDQKCTNTEGSFVCECNEGFTRSTSSCVDVNECETGKHDCEHFCRNTIGAYACTCRPGFALSTVDRRSCSQIAGSGCTNLNCSQQCEKTGSNETCFCNNGYKLAGDGITCKDIDECETSTDPCSGVGASCHNNGGGYTCKCEHGFLLQSDGVTCLECEDGKYGDECNNTCSCVFENTEICIKNNGSCKCKSGWEGDKCDVDIDECKAPISKECGSTAACKNTNGSSFCECNTGYFKTSAETCEECDSNHYGKFCRETCTCGVNSKSCNSVSGNCTCKDGWTGSNCNDDVNECDNVTICSGTPDSTCHNNNGSYSCKCSTGYLLNPSTNKCDDLDECVYADLNTCVQNCTNTDGNHTCSCNEGYTGTWNTCKDVNECEKNASICIHIPDSNCSNTVGSYECKCHPGFAKTASKSIYCKDVDECQSKTSCDATPNSTCSNLEGTFTCDCNKGFLKNTTTGKCDDLNECTSKHGCEHGCENLHGTFKCTCRKSYTLNEDGKKCDATVLISSEVRLDADVSESTINSPDSTLYSNIVKAIAKALADYFKLLLGKSFVSIVVHSIRIGSIVANYSVEMNKVLAPNPEGSFVKSSFNLVGKNLSLVIPGGNQVSEVLGLDENATLCGEFTKLKDCGRDAYCKVIESTPVCVSVIKPTDNMPLIIGLSVGIPGFLLLLAIVIILAISKSKKGSITSSDERNGESPFSSQIGIRDRFYSYNRRLYSPDTLSAVSDDDTLRKKKHDRTSTRPTWVNRETRVYDDADTNSFSWNFLYKIMPPNEPFAIRRPRVED